MKKTLFSLLSATALLWSTSCSDDAIVSHAGGDTLVQFNVELADGGVASRAISDGSSVNQLYYEVYSVVNGTRTYLQDLDNGDKPMTITNGKANVQFALVKGQSYDIVFWAQKEGAYVADDLQDIQIGKLANNDDLDAFTYVHHIASVEGAKSETVYLTRPFAQVNFGTTDADIEAAKSAGVVFNQASSKITQNRLASQITVTDAALSYNALTKLSNESADQCNSVAFAWNKIPSFDEKLLEVGEGENKVVYRYLATAYVLVPEGDQATADLKMEIETGLNNDITVKVPNAPIRRNYRTNVLGNLLTSTTDFEIVVDADFNPDREDHIIEVWDGVSVEEPVLVDENGEALEEVSISTGSQLAWLAAAVNGTLPATFQSRAGNIQEMNIKLTSNIDLGNNPWTPIGYNPNDVAGNENYFTGTFDGNGYTISNLFVDVKDQGGVGLFGAVHNATFKNFTLVNVFVKAVESEDNPANTSGAEGKKEYIAGGHIGAVAGYDAKAGNIVFDNVHVEGLIKIESETRAAQGQRVGGIFGGRASSKISFNNVSVKGTEGSYIKGYCSTAGVVGHTQESATFNDVHTDIDVYAVTFGAGGIAGIARQSSTFTNCSSAGDITLDASKTQLSSYSANYPFRVGGIAGCWSESKTGVLTLTGCSYTGTLTSIDKDGNSPESFDYAGFVGRGYSLKNCAGSKVVIDGVEYVQAYDDVYGLYIVNGVYEIGTAAALKSFAAKVNAGDTFDGKTVKLTADIDLKNEQWMPIGYWQTFNGTFDGNSKTISNLKHHGTAEDCYVGLFGYTENATIKNLTINNVDLKLVANASWAGGHMGALVGNIEGTTVIENITVTGDVKVDGDLAKAGAGRIGGVVGGNVCNASLKNVVVNANEGSFVKGNSSVGGIAGQLQGEVSFVNCSSNINVSAQQFYAGGIIGLVAKCASFTGCSASGNVSVLAGRAGNANDLYRVGAIAGGWDDEVDVVLTLTDCTNSATLSGQSADGVVATAFDCAGFVGRGYSTEVGAKVSVNGSVYEYQGDGQYTLDGCPIVTNDEQLSVALSKTDNIGIYLAAGNYNLGKLTVGNREVVIKGESADKVTLNGSVNIISSAKNFSLSNVTFEWDGTNNGVAVPIEIKETTGLISFNNCVFKGTNYKPNGNTAGYISMTNAVQHINVEACEFNNCASRLGIWGHLAGNATTTSKICNNKFIGGVYNGGGCTLEGQSLIQNIEICNNSVTGYFRIYTTTLKNAKIQGNSKTPDIKADTKENVVVE